MQEMEDCPQPIPGCKHLCFANFQPDDNEDTLPKARRGYDPLTEEHVPACDPAHMHPMKAEAEITSIYNRLLEKITSIPQNDNTLQALAARCRSEVSSLPRSVRQIALVGETGVGKSTLINVLLGRPGQQKVANAVSQINGCTSAVIRYKYGTKLSNGGKSFRARVNFLSEDALREVLQDFKDDFVNFHLGEASDDKNPCKNTDFKRATGARHFYEFLWDQNFGDDDLKGRIVEPKFFEQTVAQSLRLISRVATQPATTTTSAYLEEFDNSSTKLLTRINKYLSQSKPADVIWCLVSDVDIYVESHVLKAGIVLVDLPGLNDINPRRVAITDKVRTSADVELIIIYANRAAATINVEQYIERSTCDHGIENTILVVTRSDDFDPGGHLDQTMEMDDQVLEYMKSCRRWSTSCMSELEPEDEHCEIHGKYNIFLERQAKLHLLAKNAKENEKEFGMRHVPRKTEQQKIEVISVSPKPYLIWLSPLPLTRPLLSVEQTCVPELRRKLMMIPAEASLKRYSVITRETLPATFGYIMSLLQRMVRKDYQNQTIYSNMLKDFRLARHNLGPELSNCFDTSLRSKAIEKTNTIMTRNTVYRRNEIQYIIDEAARELTWHTHNKIIRSYGILAPGETVSLALKGKYTNWNQDISKLFHDDFKLWMDAMEKLMSSFHSTLQKMLSKKMDRFVNIVNVVNMKDRQGSAIATREWNATRRRLDTGLDQSIRRMAKTLDKAFAYFTMERNRDSMMAEFLRPAYEKARNAPKGPGALQRERQAFRDAIVGRHSDKGLIASVVDKITSQIRSYYIPVLEEVFLPFEKLMDMELTRFEETLDNLKVYDSHLSTEQKKVRQELEALLPSLQADRDALEGRFAEAKGEATVEEVRAGLEDVEMSDM